MMDFVNTREDIIKNVKTFYKYGLRDGLKRKFHDGKIKNCKKIVAVRQGDEYRFAPNMFAGYAANSLDQEQDRAKRNDGIADSQIENLADATIKDDSVTYESINDAYLAYCKTHGIKPSVHKKKRCYWRIDAEQTSDGERGSEPFRTTFRPAWHQKSGQRAGADVVPGCQMYVAVICDDHGMTMKVGSGRAEDRLAEFNKYRRASQGEAMWSLYQEHEFDTVDAARAAEDHLLREAHAAGFASPDHSEFIVGMEIRALDKLVAEVIETGDASNE